MVFVLYSLRKFAKTVIRSKSQNAENLHQEVLALAQIDADQASKPTSNIVARFTSTLEVAISKLLPGGFGWQVIYYLLYSAK